MKIIIPDGKRMVSKTSFQGSSFFNVIVMYYLSHKHDNSCVILNEPYETKPEFNIHWDKSSPKHKHTQSCVLLPKKLSDIPSTQRMVSLRWVETDKGGYISVPKPENEFWSRFNRCTNKRFVVLPFGYDCVDSGHANYLLYDKLTCSLERFESFGKVNDSKCLNPPNLDRKIKMLFQKNLGKEYVKKYYKPLDYAPSRNFQAIQEAEKEMNADDPVGFCAVWSAWYIDLRLSNPDIERRELVKGALTLLRNQSLSFTKFIRNYSAWIVDISEEIKKLYDKERQETKRNIKIY